MLSIKDKNVYYKYLISFALSSTIPILLLFYFTYECVFPYLRTNKDIFLTTDNVSIIVFLAVFLSSFGFFLALDTIKALERLTGKVRKFNTGKPNGQITPLELARKDELGQLANNIEILISSSRSHTDKLNSLINQLDEARKTINSVEKKVKELSTIDELTGFFNRKYLDYRLPSEITRAEVSNANLGFMMLDADDFTKVVKDKGVDKSLEDLKKLARKIPEKLRDFDVVTRFGDDVFAFILPDISYQGMKDLSENIRRLPETMDLSFTVSLGYALFPNDGKDAGKLVMSAIQALNHAKATGKNKTVCYS